MFFSSSSSTLDFHSAGNKWFTSAALTLSNGMRKKNCNFFLLKQILSQIERKGEFANFNGNQTKNLLIIFCFYVFPFFFASPAWISQINFAKSENEMKKDDKISPKNYPNCKYMIIHFKTKELRRKEFSRVCK
jgi:hypothetical protein